MSCESFGSINAHANNFCKASESSWPLELVGPYAPKPPLCMCTYTCCAYANVKYALYPYLKNLQIHLYHMIKYMNRNTLFIYIHVFIWYVHIKARTRTWPWILVPPFRSPRDEETSDSAAEIFVHAAGGREFSTTALIAVAIHRNPLHIIGCSTSWWWQWPLRMINHRGWILQFLLKDILKKYQAVSISLQRKRLGLEITNSNIHEPH